MSEKECPAPTARTERPARAARAIAADTSSRLRGCSLTAGWQER
jgi:hypothetical protein